MPEQTASDQEPAITATERPAAQAGIGVELVGPKEQAAKRQTRRASRSKAKKERRVFVSSKRKRAVARAVIKKGAGRILINSVDVNLFEPRELRSLMLEPINTLSLAKGLARGLEIKVNVSGGGRSAQAQAVRTAIAKGLAEYSESDTLKKEYLRYDRFMLVDDSRRVEPKKFRGPKARARFQTSYR